MQQDSFHALTGGRMRRRRGPNKRMSAEQAADLWRHWRAGTNARDIGRALGFTRQRVQTVLERQGGLSPRERTRAARTLSGAEREEISRGVATGASMRAIAERLGRAPSTISRELAH